VWNGVDMGVGGAGWCIVSSTSVTITPHFAIKALPNSIAEDNMTESETKREEVEENREEVEEEKEEREKKMRRSRSGRRRRSGVEMMR
jgi:hypothetical protein